MSKPACLLQLLVVLSLLHASPVAASEDKHQEASPARFHRAYVPAERVADWPQGRNKYLPMATEEFERLVAVMKQPRNQPIMPSVAITHARYDGKVQENRIVGVAAWEVVVPDDQPAALVLEPCNLSITGVQWSDSAARENKTGQGVSVSLRPDGKVVAIVPRSGTMRFDWSLAAQPSGNGSWSFAMEVPPAASNDWNLRVPQDRAIAVDGGWITASEALPNSPWRQVRLEAESSRRCQIIIQAAEPPSAKQALVQESRTYDCSLRGLELRAEWKILHHDSPLAPIDLIVDQELQLTSAQLDAMPVSWWVSGHDSSGKTKIALKVPGPFGDTPRTLRVTAVGKSMLGESWRLPRISPQGMSWSEGTLILLLTDPLVVDRVSPIGCRQTGVDSLAQPRAGRSLQFQSYDPEATLDLILSRRPSQVAMVGIANVEVSEEMATAAVATEFSISGEARDRLEADVMQGWSVRDVRLLSGEGVAEWSIDREASDRPRLVVRLVRPFSPAKPLKLVVRCCREMLDGDSLKGDDFWPLHFRDVDLRRQLTAMGWNGSCDLQFNDGKTRVKTLAFEGLSPVESALLVNRGARLLFEHKDGAADLVGAYTRKTARCRARIDVEVTVGELAMRETTRFRCSPQSGCLDRVIVQFAPRRSSTPIWTIDGRACEVVSASRMGSPERSMFEEASAETWEIVFARPRREPFELAAARETAFSGNSIPVSLAAMPEAESQEGFLTVRSVGRNGVLIENDRLKREVFATRQKADATIFGTYRYQPSQEVAGMTVAAFRVKPDSSDGIANAFVSLASLDSWFPTGRTARHTVTYQFHGLHAGAIRFSLPEAISGDEVQAVCVDGEPVRWRVVSDEEERSLRIILGESQPSPKLTIEWLSYKPETRFVGSFRPEWMVPDVPVLAYEWTAWLPSGQISASRHFVSVEPVDQPGWRGWRCERRRDESAAFEYVDRGAMHLLGMVAFLFVSAIGCWRVERNEIKSPRLTKVTADRVRAEGPEKDLFFLNASNLAVLLCLLGAIAAVVPVAYVAMPIGGVCGVVFCGAWRSISKYAGRTRAESVRRRPGPWTSEPLTIVTPSSLAVGALVVAAMSFGNAGVSQASDTVTSNRRAGDHEYEIVIPTDETKNPLDKVYVPEPLHRQLRKLAADATAQPLWQISHATYHAELRRTTDRSAVQLVRAVYLLRVSRGRAIVSLPIGSYPESAIPPTVSLNGRAVPWEVDREHGTLTIAVNEPGEYRLEVALQARLMRDHWMASLDLPIPRVPSAKLEVVRSDEPLAVEVPSARGGVAPGQEGKRLLVELGPTNRLRLRWQEAAVGSSVNTEQLTWLTFRPGAVLVDAKFLFLATPENSLDEVQVVVDRRLRLLPIEGGRASALYVDEKDGDSRTLRIRWPKPMIEPTVLKLRFLMAGSSGVGVFRSPPRIDLQGVTISKRWLAVSADASLHIEQRRHEKIEPLPIEDFLAGWGAADRQPEMAFCLTSNDSDLEIASQPRKGAFSVDQTVKLVYDDRRVGVSLAAECHIATSPVFQHRIEVSSLFHVTHLSVRDGNLERVDHWSQDKSGTITVFLNQAAVGPRKILVRGSLPVPPEAETPLPWLRVQGADSFVSKTEVYRRPSIMVAYDRNPSKATPAAQIGCPGQGRLDGTFNWDGRTPPPVRLKVSSNRPKIRGSQAIWVRPAPVHWQAGLHCSLFVTAGVADEFTLFAPVNWEGPFQVDQPGQLRVCESSGTDRRIVFRPQNPVSGDYAFSIKGKVTIDRLQNFGLPDLRLLDSPDVRRLLMLPRRFGSDLIPWNLANVRPSAAPAGLLEKMGGDIAFYELPGTALNVKLGKSERRGQESIVRLAEIEAVVQADDSWFSRATLDVDPGAKSEGILRLPSGAEILSVMINGDRVVPVEVRDGEWKCPWVSAPSSQHVEIVYRGPPASTSTNDALQILPPRFDQIPVQKLVWIVSLPEHQTWEVEGGGIPISDNGRCEAARPPSGSDRGPVEQKGPLLSRQFRCYLGDGDVPLAIRCRRERPIELRHVMGFATVLLGAGVMVGNSLLRRA